MKRTAFELERRYLMVSASGNLLVGFAALAASASSSRAILLDGLFNLTYFATGLFTIRVMVKVAGGDDERFPHGYAFLEPLVNGIKGMLVLGVSVMALADSVRALVAGGTSIAAGIAVLYAVFASTVCWSMTVFMRRGTKTVSSPLVRADAENWLVNSAISSCVLLAFLGIFLFNAIGLSRFSPYVDPSVVIVVVAITLVVPVRMSWNSIMALLNRAPGRHTVRRVAEIVDECLAGLPVQESFVRVIQPGRQRMVLIHVVLPTDYEIDRLESLDSIRDRTYEKLCEDHEPSVVDMVFTADRRWGSPQSEGGIGGPRS